MGKIANEKVLNALDSPKRVFICTDEITEKYEKRFKFMREDERLLQFAMDNVGQYSDAFILYAVAYLGAATKETISEFLKVLQKQCPELSIIYEKNKMVLEARMRALYSTGLLFAFDYLTTTDEGLETEDEQAMALYTVSSSGFSIAKQRLTRHLALNDGFQYKPISELIDWAATSYVASKVMNTDSFYSLLDHVFRTAQVGSVYLPAEVKTQKYGEFHYVAFLNSSLRRNPYTQSVLDYKEYRAHKLNIIKNYLYARTKKGIASVVVVVRDKEELDELCLYISKMPPFFDYLNRIYFTSEGIVREFYDKYPTRCFLGIERDSSEIGYHYIEANPAFM